MMTIWSECRAMTGRAFRRRVALPGRAERASAAARSIAGGLHGVCLSRAVVPALLLLTLLAGVAMSHASAQTTPTLTFESASSSVDEGAGTHHVTVRLSPAPTTKADLIIVYARQHPRYRGNPDLHDGSTATPGSDYVIPHSRSYTYTYTKISRIPVPAGATTVTVPVTIVDDSDPEGDETVILHYSHVTLNPAVEGGLESPEAL